jgi:hypothetical protein
LRIIALFVAAAVISGCAATYKQSNLAEPSAKLIKGKSVVIATPANGYYGSREYSGSGRMTALAVRAAFARHTNTITVSPDCKDLGCLQGSKATSFEYYVIPEILHWEDRVTSLFGPYIAFFRGKNSCIHQRTPNLRGQKEEPD